MPKSVAKKGSFLCESHEELQTTKLVGGKRIPYREQPDKRLNKYLSYRAIPFWCVCGSRFRSTTCPARALSSAAQGLPLIHPEASSMSSTRYLDRSTLFEHCHPPHGNARESDLAKHTEDIVFSGQLISTSGINTRGIVWPGISLLDCRHALTEQTVGVRSQAQEESIAPFATPIWGT